MLVAPPAQAFTVAFETLPASAPFVVLVDGQVWVRFRSGVRVGAGTTVRVMLDIGELGRPLDLVCEVFRETVVGLDCRVVQAALADLVVLYGVLGPAKDASMQGARALVVASQPPTGSAGASAGAALPGLGGAMPELEPAPVREGSRSEPRADGPKLPDLAFAGGAAALGMNTLVIHDKASIVSHRIVGIDLGTCNSCVSIVEHGRPRTFTDETGNDNVPSVVSYLPNGTHVVGTKAVEMMEEFPDRTITGSKRFIGRPFNSQPVQTILHKFSYKVVPDAEWGTAIQIDREAKSLITVASHILGHLKNMAERNVGQEVVRAVITVPAYYNDNQRHAVKRAGALAGLQVERIIEEPTAAAIAFGLSDKENSNSAERKILVYDLGGGTFDVSLLRCQGTSFNVIATAGDNFLGGEDFDNRIVDWVIEAYEKGYNQQIWSTHPGVRVKLKRAAEKAKIELSDKDVSRIDLPDVPLTTRGTTRVIANLTRTTLEQLVDRYIDRTLLLCDMAMREAKVKPDELSAVVLVGGQTKMPHVRNRLIKKFGKLVRTDVDPARAVAIGAGLLAQAVEEGFPSVNLQAVLPMTIGLATPQDPTFKPIIQRNTPLPFRQAFPVSVPVSQWASFTVDVFQGDSAVLTENEYLGTMQIYDLPSGTRDPAQLTIEFELTKECLLKVWVQNAGTGQKHEILLINKEVAPSISALNTKSAKDPNALGPTPA